MSTVTAREIYESLLKPDAPWILDVRNVEERERWPIESGRPVHTLNIPYFEFIENETESVERVKKWLGDRRPELAVLCAKGGSSEYVSEILRNLGISAANVEGGMIAWGSQTVSRPISTRTPLLAWQILRFGKGCLSYILASENEALVVDPHRHPQEYADFLKQRHLTLKAVLDTHLHADHISGAAALSQQARVPYYASSLDFYDATFDYEPVETLEHILIGKTKVVPIRIVPTPGHTPGSTCYGVDDQLLLTGDTVFVGGIGRPDLGGKALEWGLSLYRSLTIRLASIPDDTMILPAHTSGPSEMNPDGVTGERWGVVKQKNPALRLDEKSFVQQIAENVAPAPAAYATIRRINMGTLRASEEELEEMELGKNECALKRR